jgi:hypothetical protein
MPVFTVHAPVAAANARADVDDFVFVRDGFHFWAFLLGPFWLAWHRLWLVLLAYLVIISGVIAAMVWLRTGADTRTIVLLLIASLIGYEAASAKRWTLSRGRWREVGVVVGDDAESAERRFFAQWTGESVRPRTTGGDRSPPPLPPGRPGAPHDVIGLFPQPGVPR